jgi:hypothetical protein
MALSKVTCTADVEGLRTTCDHLERRLERQWFPFMLEHAVECRSLVRIQYGIVCEVRRRVGLICGDERNEVRFGHRLERVVGFALLADGRPRVLTDLFAAQRSRAVRGVHKRLIGQRQQLLARRAVKRVRSRR